MFCALHVVVAFGVLLVVCSLVRANTVRLRVQLRQSPVQIFRPSCRFLFFFSFLSVAKPGVLASFSPLVGTRCCLHVFHVALSVCRACLGEVPAWFFSLPLFVSLLSSIANQSLRESFFSCLRPARER